MKRILFLICSILLSLGVRGQQDSTTHKIMFYNVENLFHPSDDSLTADEDFTPTGSYHWTYKKYYKKVSMIGKVIVALGEGDPPWLVGLAEIENEQVLKDLCYRSPLRKFGYRYVHYNSPDRRGVDVALLYRDSCVRVLRSRKVPVVFPFDTHARNRDILYVVVQFPSGDSLNLLVNHWTSRYGGYAATVPKRNYHAMVVRSLVDSLLSENPRAKVLITGDFNDYATDESMVRHLRAREFNARAPDDTLYNLMLPFTRQSLRGTHKHEDFWGCLDQFIVSNAWLTDTCGVRQVGGAHIFDADFLLVDDEKYGGKKNFRTFLGPRYIGGFADHLPVYVVFRE
jgi:predicted extracellular nuclease